MKTVFNLREKPRHHSRRKSTFNPSVLELVQLLPDVFPHTAPRKHMDKWAGEIFMRTHARTIALHVISNRKIIG